ncbi:MAG TPA: LysM domain-containing protein [Candidatus Limnocylindrales bacterium]|nr:LysM domain-containing protein [Candidatus Limnocylindrales bacterium]
MRRKRQRPLVARSNRPAGDTPLDEHALDEQALDEAETQAIQEATVEAAAAAPADAAVVEEPPAGVPAAPAKAAETGAAEESATPPDGPAPTDEPPWARRRASGVLVAFSAVVLVIALAGTAGYGLALFVAGLNSVRAPDVPFASPTPTTGIPSTTPSTAPAPSGPASPTPSATGPTPIPSQAVHIVARGENLTQIARRYGVTVEAIALANGIEDPNLIEPGQRLIIPPREGAAPSP